MPDNYPFVGFAGELPMYEQEEEFNGMFPICNYFFPPELLIYKYRNILIFD